MLGDIRRRSKSIRINQMTRPADWKSDVWIRKINQFDQLTTQTSEFEIFKKTFADAGVSMEEIFPKLSPRGMDIVLDTFPDRAPELTGLCPDLSASSLGRLPLDKLFEILFKIIEENGELSENFAHAASKRLKESKIQDVLRGFASCSSGALQSVLFASLDFELQLIIYGNGNSSHEDFLCDFISRFREELNRDLNSHLAALSRAYSRMQELKWILLVNLMSTEQLMPFLSYIDQEQFERVHGRYKVHFNTLIKDKGEAELTYWLRRCSNPELSKFIPKMLQKDACRSLGDYFVHDRDQTQDYLNRALTKSGHENRLELVGEMIEDEKFFSVRRFFSLLKEVVTSQLIDPRFVRRALLVASLLLDKENELVLYTAPIVRKMTSAKLTDRAALKLQAQLAEEVDTHLQQQYAQEIVGYLRSGVLSVSEAVFGYLSFTTTGHLLQAIRKTLQDGLPPREKECLFEFLVKWLRTIATEDDVSENKSILSGFARMREQSRIFHRFTRQLRRKKKEIKGKLDSKERSISPVMPVDMEKVMRTRFKRNQKYIEDLNAITLDLKEYALSLFSEIQFGDLVHHSWSRGLETDSSVSRMIGQWNQLAKSVQSKIFDDALKCAERGRVIEFFIDLALNLYHYGDFHSSYAIYNGLALTELDRFQPSWNNVSKKHKKKKKSLDEYYESQYNYRSIRRQIKVMAESGMMKACPAITFLGHDLAPIAENLPSLVGNHLNAEKVKCLSRIYSEFYHWISINRHTECQKTRSTAVRTLASLTADEADPWTIARKRNTVG